MSKSAVEWLEKEFIKLEATVGVHGIMYELLEQAKELEKQNTIDAVNYGNEQNYYDNTGKAAEKYWEDNYGTKKTN